MNRSTITRWVHEWKGDLEGLALWIAATYSMSREAAREIIRQAGDRPTEPTREPKPDYPVAQWGE